MHLGCSVHPHRQSSGICKSGVEKTVHCATKRPRAEPHRDQRTFISTSYVKPLHWHESCILASDVMRVAIPEHQNRVAPVFDCCRKVLVVVHDLESDRLLVGEDWSALSRFARAYRLKMLRVELLVCGGISGCLETLVRRNGIDVLPWIAGDVWEVLAALRTGTISDPRYAMPGRLCRWRGGPGTGRGHRL
jgi:predicted Fe-Mo cluster-binding NifX family protein